MELTIVPLTLPGAVKLEQEILHNPSAEPASTVVANPTSKPICGTMGLMNPSAPNSSAPSFRVATLGCKVNQYETQYVRDLLLANGYREALANEPARLAVVNTCTVTAESDHKSRRLIRQIAKANPGVKIVVMGCYATADPATVQRLPGVVAVIKEKRDLQESLRPFGVTQRVRGIRNFEGRQRAFVKVQDGCILDCTFCIIPKVRPGLLSRHPEDIVAEVQGLVEAGYREMILTGIHLGHYGIDLSQGRPRRDWQRLWHLLTRLAALPGDFRVRLSSLEATEVTDDFLRVLADHQDRVCPHLHLSLQSGSNRVLGLMKRRYRVEKFLAKCELARARMDLPALTTDIIVGFPGETEADFAATVATARTAGFCKIHIFPFSARAGTPAALMPEQPTKELLQDRRAALAEVERDLARTYYRQLLGRRLEMLVESPDPAMPEMMRGTACRYAPLRLHALPALARHLVPVVARQLLEREHEQTLIVEPVNESLETVS